MNVLWLYKIKQTSCFILSLKLAWVTINALQAQLFSLGHHHPLRQDSKRLLTGALFNSEIEWVQNTVNINDISASVIWCLTSFYYLAAPFMFSLHKAFFFKIIDDKLINNEKCKQGFLIIIWHFLVLIAIDCTVFVIKGWKGALIIIVVTSKCFIQVSDDSHIR